MTNPPEFGKLSIVEKLLYDDLMLGKGVELHKAPKRPSRKINRVIVRADFISWLVLKASVCHDRGVQLDGAWIEGELNLEGATLRSRLALVNCVFEKKPILFRLNLNGDLSFQGSLMPGLYAENANIFGNVFLSMHFESQDEVSLIGIQINGDLDCSESLLSSENGHALSANHAQVKGSVIFSSANCRGLVTLNNSTINSDLDCDKAVFYSSNSQDESQTKVEDVGSKNTALDFCKAEIKSSAIFTKVVCNGSIMLKGANIEGDLDFSCAEIITHTSELAIVADRLRLIGSLFFRKGFACEGIIRMPGAQVRGSLDIFETKNSLNGIDLSHANVYSLQDSPEAWGVGHILDGFVYQAFRGDGWNGLQRIGWLKNQRKDHRGDVFESQLFKPQPWQQLISVLRKMGHNDMASDIAIAFEQRRYEIGKVGSYQKVENAVGEKSTLVSIRNFGRVTNHHIVRAFHKLFGWLAGYGYKPLRLLWWMFGVWLTFGFCYWSAAYQGVFAPSDPLVFQNTDYDDCRMVDANNGKPRIVNNLNTKVIDGVPVIASYNWYTCGDLKGEYTTFSPLAYSLDVILPLVDLGQEKTWGVYIETPVVGKWNEFRHYSYHYAVRLMVWFEILFGWLASLMLVAVLTGLTERDKS